jgi:two-component system chemotaxis response regulator CheB
MTQKPARVLIVDDSVIIRSLLSRLVGEDTELTVVGTSANGRLALRRLAQRDVDVVILDIDMPELDGLETLRVLKRDFPSVHVIMFSSLTEAGAWLTVECLAIGADDYVLKPTTTAGSDRTATAVREELVRKIKAACFGERVQRTPDLSAPPGSAGTLAAPIELIAIGCSTGGPNALARVLSELPARLPAPIVIVQHMPPVFTGLLAERLNRACPLEVREAVHGEIVRPGSVWLAPGGQHMTVNCERQLTIELNQADPVNFCRPSVDVLFDSVAAAMGARVLGLVLTGMGQDGLRGAAQIRRSGGRIIVQDQLSSVVWGMPGYVARANLAHEILPLETIAEAIVRTVDASRPADRRPLIRVESSRG